MLHITSLNKEKASAYLHGFSVCYLYRHVSPTINANKKKLATFYTVSQKHPQHFQLQLENQLSDFDNFW